MTNIENQVIETWRTHNHITISVLENILDEALKATLSTRGGRDIGRQFAHMNAVRVWQLEAFAKKNHYHYQVFQKMKLRQKIYCSKHSNKPEQQWKNI